MRKPIWKIVIPDPCGLCPACGGSGSEWATRKDGQPDRRYVRPIGPCPECNGQPGYRTAEEWREIGVCA